MNDIHKKLLQHMLGADSRYMKKQWGFRNHFYATKGTADDVELEKMKTEGLVTCTNRVVANVYHATKLGATLIGFKNYQLIKARLTN